MKTECYLCEPNKQQEQIYFEIAGLDLCEMHKKQMDQFVKMYLQLRKQGHHPHLTIKTQNQTKKKE